MRIRHGDLSQNKKRRSSGCKQRLFTGGCTAMNIVDAIARIPLFEGLPSDQMEDLVMILTDQVFRKGETVFSEGEEANGFYVVARGRVKVYKLSPDGKEQILHIFGPGDPFGEVPVFTGQRFPAHAEALEESRVLFFPKQSFVKLITQNPTLALNMLGVLSKRLRRFTALIDDLSLKEVPGRLAAHLLFLSRKEKGSKELELSITKAQLASLLGTIPETLSRILAKMTAQGLIETQGRRIRILDRESLQELVDSGGRF
jgi:CRP/FNR family transcriptional regulator, dissimilatory nitrate respiration regulator